MLSKPQEAAAGPAERNATQRQGLVTVQNIMEAAGSPGICLDDIRLGMPTPKEKDYVGDMERSGTLSLTFGNVNKPLFNTKDVRPKKGNEQLWFPKHTSVCLLQDLTGADMMMCKDGGLIPRGKW